MVRHSLYGARPPNPPEDFLDAIPPVGAIIILCLGCWAMFILAGWGIWQLVFA
jgi:hypothetical protein